jgi:hypothetical protein
LKIPVAGIFKGDFLRSHIFTVKELDAIQEYLKTGKRTPAFNKLLWAVRHNYRILEDLQIFLILLRLAHEKTYSEPFKLPPGRPPKLVTEIRRGLKQ